MRRRLFSRAGSADHASRPAPRSPRTEPWWSPVLTMRSWPQVPRRRTSASSGTSSSPCARWSFAPCWSRSSSRIRRSGRADEATPADVSGLTRHERGPYMAVLWGVAVSIALLLAMLVASVATDRALAHMSLVEAVNVEVTAHQWWWELQYAGTPESARFSTANELHVPVGRPVILTLKSDDVIHSFWVPSLARQEGPDPRTDDDPAFPGRPARPLPRPVRRVLRPAARVHGVRGDRRPAGSLRRVGSRTAPTRGRARRRHDAGAASEVFLRQQLRACAMPSTAPAPARARPPT